MSVNNPQLTPVSGNKEVAVEVIKDLLERRGLGKEKYGTVLMADNGHDALIDAYHDVLDLVQYIKQELMERENHPIFSREDLSMLEFAVSNLLLSNERYLFPVKEKRWDELIVKLQKLLF